MSQTALSVDDLHNLEAQDDRFPYVTGVVPVDLDDLLHGDFESFLDDISTKLVGSPLLMDITYRVTGTADDNTIHIEVTGDASAALDDLEDANEPA